jgi:hypothetical protein
MADNLKDQLKYEVVESVQKFVSYHIFALGQ